MWYYLAAIASLSETTIELDWTGLDWTPWLPWSCAGRPYCNLAVLVLPGLTGCHRLAFTGTWYGALPYSPAFTLFTPRHGLRYNNRLSPEPRILSLSTSHTSTTSTLSSRSASALAFILILHP
ncbi:hypothetical protein BHE90_009081 [Fusarium euwallaceae]|uniref:Uncharacterized protein n=3 Tax=Fusarium solani species complex TaxID=232080 RepID=A0A3M2S2J2_9HYPO|nr:hypothetical protein CDV36_008594 [Fusarium kuroshium]RSL95432.1 hypothetical protein CDV31_013895 [Fusarium ambrosium]RTE76458.1 hypothetical protein BHE90_009081 [Fusarium euwallaceae]